MTDANAAPFNGLMATPEGGFSLLGGAHNGTPLSQFDYSTLSPEHRQQLSTALSSYAPLANSTAEQELQGVMPMHTRGRRAGGITGGLLGATAMGLGAHAISKRFGGSALEHMVAPAVGTLAGGLGGAALGNRVGERFDRASAMPIAQQNANFNKQMAGQASSELERLHMAGQKMAAAITSGPGRMSTASYEAGAYDALSALGLDKSAAFGLAGIASGLTNGVKALAPAASAVGTGVANAGRALSSGIAQGYQAAKPVVQGAYNAVKPMAQKAVGAVKNFVGNKTVAGQVASNSVLPGATQAYQTAKAAI